MNKTCFIVCPIGDERSDIRRDADLLLDHVIEPACDKLSISCVRADKEISAGLISNKIIRHIRDCDIVIADLSNHNPNVFYEVGIRHALGKPAILIKHKTEKTPFDVQGIKIIDFGDVSNDDNERKKLKSDLVRYIGFIIDGSDDLDVPYKDILSAAAIGESQFTSSIGEVLAEITGIRDYLYNNFSSDASDKTRINAQYIDGEDRAFAALTEATWRAKKEIRSSRFFPDSVLGNQDYVKAIEARVLGSDGRKPLSKYYRIVALNNPEKVRDIIHHLTMFKGRPFLLHLTRIPNAFELVVIDDTDAFIHFYKEKQVIASTLHIKERSIVWEFKEIYDKLLKNTDSAFIFDCTEIETSNLAEIIADVTGIFSDMVEASGAHTDKAGIS